MKKALEKHESANMGVLFRLLKSHALVYSIVITISLALQGSSMVTYGQESRQVRG